MNKKLGSAFIEAGEKKDIIANLVFVCVGVGLSSHWRRGEYNI